jgi:hypothetical protein
MATALIAVCSAKPHTVHQRAGQKLTDPWKRDVYHIAHSGITTLCGRDRSGWLTIGPIQQITPDCCTRCARIVMKRKL